MYLLEKLYLVYVLYCQMYLVMKKNAEWHKKKAAKDKEVMAAWRQSRNDDDLFVAEWEVIEFYLHKIYFSKSVLIDPNIEYY